MTSPLHLPPLLMLLGLLSAVAIAAGPLPDSPPLRALIRLNDEQVGAALAQPDAGFDRHLELRRASSRSMQFAAAYTHPASGFHQDPRLITAITRLAEYLRRQQPASGLFDVGNLESPPDTAFILDNLCQAQALLRRVASPATARAEQALAAVILAAADGVAHGGVHTPNHRWHVAATLLHLHALYPNPHYAARAEQWLAEGLDQDRDGQFSERSPAYNSRVNLPALLLLAHRLNRPELLDAVRRNLELTLACVEPDGDVETVASRRQDQWPASPLPVWEFYVPFRYLAVVDQNPRYAAVARWIERDFLPRLLSRPIDPNVPLPLFLELPVLNETLPTADETPWPTEETVLFSGSHLARIRRGPVTATVYGGSDASRGLGVASGLAMNPTFFKLRKGAAVLESVRMTPAFFSTGFFYSEGLQYDGTAFRLHQTVRVPYYLPLPPAARQPDGDYALSADGRFFAKMDFSRRPRDERALQSTITVTELGGAFNLEFVVDGQPGVRVALELAFAGDGRLEGVSPVTPPAGDDGAREDAFVLSDGMGRFTVGMDTIEFGPGAFEGPPGPMESEAVRWVGGRMRPAGQRVYLTGATPFRHTLTLR